MIFDIKDYGAIGDGVTMNTQALQKAIDDCASKGGGQVLFENGTYLTGTIILRSNVELHIASNAVLLGSPDCADYPERETKHVDSSLLPRWRNACLIYAEECENISITGTGTIDCNGHNFVKKREGDDITGWDYIRFMDKPTPPRAVFFTGCKNIKVEDVTMVNQPAGWSYWIHDCDYVTFDKIKIIANVNYPNNDGIHINSSRNVTISNCSITCGDDCIVVRANNVSLKENKVCERVVVTNCNLTSYSAGIRIGWINDGTIRNCSFSNLVMTDTTTGISISLPYLKHNPNVPGTSDIGREATVVENLSFNNIIMSGTAARPIRISIDPRPDVMCDRICNLYFNNIHSKGPELPMLVGREDCHLQNIWLTDCSFVCTDGSEIPNLKTHGATYGYNGQIKPLDIRFADNVRISNTNISSL